MLQSERKAIALDPAAADLSGTDLYRAAEALFAMARKPASGLLTDAADLAVAPSGRDAVFVGTLTERLEGIPPTRLCTVELASGKHRILSAGPGSDRFPQFSPDGRTVAF